MQTFPLPSLTLLKQNVIFGTRFTGNELSFKANFFSMESEEILGCLNQHFIYIKFEGRRKFYLKNNTLK